MVNHLTFKAFSYLALMRIESALMISHLKRISPKALSMHIKNNPSREVVLSGPMRINVRAPRACDTARKIWCVEQVGATKRHVH